MNGLQAGQVLTFDQLNSYAVNRGGEYEATKQTLYDFQTYPDVGQLRFDFFSIPQGQGGKTIQDTNMTIAGSLPAPIHYLISSIEIHLYPDLNPSTFNNTAGGTVNNFTNDIYEILSARASLDLFIGSKSYLQEAPLMRFPPKTYMDVDSSNSVAGNGTDVNVATEYAHACGRPYILNPLNILLVPTQNFSVRLDFASLVPTISTVNARIGIVMDGVQYRLSQ